MTRVLIPRASLEAYVTATTVPNEALYPFGVMIGAECTGEEERRVAEVISLHRNVTAAELCSNLPSGIQLHGCMILQSASADASDAAKAFLNGIGCIVRVDTSAEDNTVSIVDGICNDQPSDCSVIIEAVGAAAIGTDLSELPVFHASFLTSWHGATAADFLSRCDELQSSLTSQQSSFAWSFADRGVAASWSGRIIPVADAENEQSEELAVNAWNLQSSDSPLVARNKAQYKEATASSSSSSSSASSKPMSSSATAAPLSIADYAIELNLLQRSSSAVAATSASASSSIDVLVSAPTLIYTRGGPLRTLAISLSVLHYANPASSLNSVFLALRQALIRQLEQVREKLMKDFEPLMTSLPNARAFTIQALHFQPSAAATSIVSSSSSSSSSLPQPFSHALTVLFLHDALVPARSPPPSDTASLVLFPPPPPEDDLDALHPALQPCPQESTLMRPQRVRLHTIWSHLLRGRSVANDHDGDTPTFRFSCALPMPSLISTHTALGLASPSTMLLPGSGGMRLRDVHTTISHSSGVVGGKLHLISGSYAYYHYMQDHGLNDAGWGCAYRTLQSICSWFILQGYTSLKRTVPSIRDIQAILVAANDKPSRFVGSSEWIGSTEIGIVLNWALGIGGTKTLFVSSGAEVVSHARQLAAHFDTQGTPIMPTVIHEALPK